MSRDRTVYAVGPAFPILVWVFLSIPGMFETRPGPGLLKSTIVSLFGVVVPPTLFLLSLLLVPASKGDRPCGWVNGFSVGEMALLPVVLVATAALYYFEVFCSDSAPPRWAVLGICAGAIGSTFYKRHQQSGDGDFDSALLPPHLVHGAGDSTDSARPISHL